MNWCNPSNTIISLNFAYNFLGTVGIYFTLLLLWGIYRYVYNNYIDLKIKSSNNLNHNIRSSNLIGFRYCLFGTILKYIYLSLICISQILLCIVVWNVICSSAIDVQPYWNQRAKTYIIFYCTGLILCLLLYFMEPFFSTFFFLRDTLDKCSFVKSRIDENLFESIKNMIKDLYKNQVINENDKNEVILPLLPVLKRHDNTRYLCYNQVTYMYTESISDFACYDHKNLKNIMNRNGTNTNGLSFKEVNELILNIGKNNIDLKVPNKFRVFGKEMLHPLNILRLGSLWQGIFLRFYIWSILWGIMILYTTFKTLKLIIDNQENIKKALENYVERLVMVKRDGRVVNIPSHELVPGDLIFLPQGFIAPCDIYVVSGCAIVNESFITGESNPILKMQIDPEFVFCELDTSKNNNKNTCSTLDFISEEFDLVQLNSIKDNKTYECDDTKSTIQDYKPIPKPIYMGTKIINSFSSNESYTVAIGIVYRTGIYSSHGQLLFKTIHSFSNKSLYSISNVKYIKNIYSLWLIMLISAFIVIFYQNYLLGWSTGSFFFAVGTFIQLLPLWAPTCIQFSLRKSVERLEKLCSLSTTFPMDIPLAGKLKVVCLDKTGTLTHSKMTFIGTVNAFKFLNNFSHDEYDSNKQLLIDHNNLNSNFELENDQTFLQSSNKHELNIQIQNELNWETSTVSYDEEDPLINTRTNEMFNQSFLEKSHLPPIINTKSLSHDDLIYIGLCCCHNLIPQNTINGMILLGNDIDKALFSTTDAKIKIYNERRFISLSKDNIVDDSIDNIYEYPIEIIRINEFDWNNLCMSVVAYHRVLDKYFIFCKGSYEVLLEISSDMNNKPLFINSNDENYNESNYLNNVDNEYDQELVDAKEVLNSTIELQDRFLSQISNKREQICRSKLENYIVDGYSKLGYYVMGMSYREINDKVLIDALLNKPKSNVSRKTIECNLTFISYLLFFNDIRSSITEFIHKIKISGIKPVILTGDSAYTALSVAKKSGIISSNLPVAICDVIFESNFNSDKNGGTLIWYDAINGPNKTIPPSKIYESSEYKFLIVTSKAFMYLKSQKYVESSNYDRIKSNSQERINKVPLKYFNNDNYEVTLLDIVFDRIKIFSRANPEHKRAIISEYKKRNIIVGMIGDGVNDLPAFKMADVSISIHDKSEIYDNNNGININNNDSSPMTLAFSSFSIETDNLIYVLDLIKEGRAAMVTTFSLFMFFSSQGIFYSFYKNVLFAIAQANLPVMTYVFIDIILVFPSIWLMILCKPKKRIQATRPTNTLLGPRTVLSFLSLLGTSFFFYSIVMSRLLRSSWMISSYEHNRLIPVERWFERQDNYEASCTFLWMGLQLSSLSLIFSFGGHYRERVTKNKYLICWVIFCHIFLLTLCITGPNALTCLFRVNCTDQTDRFWKFEFLGFNVFTLTGGKFQGSGSNNLFPFLWKIEFLFWNYSSIFFMSLIYWWITSNINIKKQYKLI